MARNLNLASDTGRRRHWLTELPQHREVPPHCFLNIPFGLLQRPAGRYAARQIRDVGGPIVLRSLENDCVSLAHCLISNPAAFKIDFSVPTGTSSPGRRGIVTTLGF